MDLLGGIVPCLVLAISLLLGSVSLVLELRNGPSSADLFFTGNRQLSTVPMAVSLATNFLTPLSWLALPLEVSHYGLQPVLASGAGLLLATPIAIFVFLPVFFQLQPTTAFEYLQKRFGAHVQLVASGLFICQAITALPIWLYVPAVALQTVIGAPFLMTAYLVLAVAITSTAMGGMRSLQWSSCIHVIVAATALVGVLVHGDNATLWSQLPNRAFPDHGEKMHSLWTMGGGFVAGAHLLVGQPQVQRYLSVPFLPQARRAIILAAIVLLALTALLTWCGMLMSVQLAASSTLALPHEHALEHFLPFLHFSVAQVEYSPWLGGLMVAALAGITLSVVSSGVHALSTVLAMDLWGGARRWCQACRDGDVKTGNPEDIPARRSREVMALAAVLVLVAFGAALCAPSAMLGAASTFPYVTSGTLLGLFSLGMLVPWANSAGALAGAAVSLALTWWVTLELTLSSDTSQLEHKNFTSDLRNNTSSISSTTSVVGIQWVAPLGFAVTIAVGVVISALIYPRDPHDLNPDLVAPCVAWLHFRIRGWPIGEAFEDSSIQEDFHYEAVSTASRLDVLSDQSFSRVTRGVVIRGSRRERRGAGVPEEQQNDEQEWPDVTYHPHLSRSRTGVSTFHRRSLGLAWDERTGELYLSQQQTLPMGH